jgi:2-iminobutanoate/2-iminopropanoate deaminase
MVVQSGPDRTTGTEGHDDQDHRRYARRTPIGHRGPVRYSQAVRVGELVFVSGQGPFDPVTGAIVGENIGEQTAQCLRNIEAILYAAGTSLAKVASCTFILRHAEDFVGLNEEWARWFPTDPQARSAVLAM